MEELPDLGVEARLKRDPTIDGSDSHQFMVFKPNSRGFKVAPCLCVCDSCLIVFGSCALFTKYQLQTCTLNKMLL